MCIWGVVSKDIAIHVLASYYRVGYTNWSRKRPTSVTKLPVSSPHHRHDWTLGFCQVRRNSTENANHALQLVWFVVWQSSNNILQFSSYIFLHGLVRLISIKQDWTDEKDWWMIMINVVNGGKTWDRSQSFLFFVFSVSYKAMSVWFNTSAVSFTYTSQA